MQLYGPGAVVQAVIVETELAKGDKVVLAVSPGGGEEGGQVGDDGGGFGGAGLVVVGDGGGGVWITRGGVL